MKKSFKEIISLLIHRQNKMIKMNRLITKQTLIRQKMHLNLY
jgi:hypothetical protein